MASDTSERDAETQIRGRIDHWLNALHDKDIDRVMAHYASAILVCDLAPPLRRSGMQALKQSLEDWFPTWEGPIGFELRDLQITAGDDIAYCHGLKRISGRKTDGEEPDVWTRATLCFRKIDGEWRITHEYESVPFYMDGSGRAAVDLKPEGLRGKAVIVAQRLLEQPSRLFRPRFAGDELTPIRSNRRHWCLAFGQMKLP